MDEQNNKQRAMTKTEKAAIALQHAGYDACLTKGNGGRLKSIHGGHSFFVHDVDIEKWAKIYDEKAKSAVKNAIKLVDEVDDQIRKDYFSSKEVHERLGKAKKLLQLYLESLRQDRDGKKQHTDGKS